MKNKSLTYAVLALVVGYILGSIVGIPGIDKNQTCGDVNTVNTYNEILTSPDYMAFQKEYCSDSEVQARTRTTLMIINSRITEFNAAALMAESIANGNAAMAEAVKAIKATSKQNSEAAIALKEAFVALDNLENGQKVNLKKALAQAQKAYDVLDIQTKAAKAFVQAADANIDHVTTENAILASIRDLLAGHSAVNATLVQNDAEIDYWQNINSLVHKTDVAQK